MVDLFLLKSLIVLELLSSSGFSCSEAQDGVLRLVWENDLISHNGWKRDIDREQINVFRIMAQHIGPSMPPPDAKANVPNYDALDFHEKKVDTLKEIRTTLLPKLETYNMGYSNQYLGGKQRDHVGINRRQINPIPQKWPPFRLPQPEKIGKQKSSDDFSKKIGKQKSSDDFSKKIGKQKSLDDFSKKVGKPETSLSERQKIYNYRIPLNHILPMPKKVEEYFTELNYGPSITASEVMEKIHSPHYSVTEVVTVGNEFIVKKLENGKKIFDAKKVPFKNFGKSYERMTESGLLAPTQTTEYVELQGWNSTDGRDYFNKNLDDFINFGLVHIKVENNSLPDKLYLNVRPYHNINFTLKVNKKNVASPSYISESKDISKKDIGLQAIDTIKLQSEKNIFQPEDANNSVLFNSSDLDIRNAANIMQIALPLNKISKDSDGKILWNLKQNSDTSNFIEIGNKIKPIENVTDTNNNIFYVSDKNGVVTSEVSSQICKKFMSNFFKQYRYIVALFIISVIALLIMFLLVVYKLGQTSRHNYQKVKADDYPPEFYKKLKPDGWFQRKFKGFFERRKTRETRDAEEDVDTTSLKKESQLLHQVDKDPLHEKNHLESLANFREIPLNNDLNAFEKLRYPERTKPTSKSILQFPSFSKKPEIPEIEKNILFAIQQSPQHFKIDTTNKDESFEVYEADKKHSVKKDPFSILHWIQDKFSSKQITVSSTSSEDSPKEDNADRCRIITLVPEKVKRLRDRARFRHRRGTPAESNASETSSEGEGPIHEHASKRKRRGKQKSKLISNDEILEKKKGRAILKQILREVAKYESYLKEKEKHDAQKEDDEEEEEGEEKGKKQKRPKSKPLELNSIVSETTFDDVVTFPASQDSLKDKIVTPGDCKPIDEMLTGSIWERSFYTAHGLNTVLGKSFESIGEHDVSDEKPVGAKRVSLSQVENVMGVCKRSSSVNSLQKEVEKVITNAETMIKTPQPISKQEYKKQMQ